MNNFYSNCLALLMIVILSLQVRSQTLIMNEVSNGPSGNQEYVELAVVSNVVTYDCNSPIPPCIDIRGWIFDDNSGYHGAVGIAAGAVRFSQGSLWACIPLGSFILRYKKHRKIIYRLFSIKALIDSMNVKKCLMKTEFFLHNNVSIILR